MKSDQGSNLCFLSRDPNLIFKSYSNVLCQETSESYCSLQKFEGAPGERELPAQANLER